MTPRTPRFFAASTALAALVALTGCESTQAPELTDLSDGQSREFDLAYDADQAGPTDMSLHDVPTQALEGSLPYPAIDSFQASPDSLPLGGGEVVFDWKARDVSSCALVDTDRQVVAIGGAQDRIEIDVEDAGEFRLVCSSDDSDDSAEAFADVEVETAPDVALDSVASKMNYANGAKEAATGDFSQADTDQWVINIFETSHVGIDIAPESDSRDMVTAWLVSDDDEDEAIHWTEVIDFARSNHGESINVTLEPGRYHVVVEAIDGATDYRLDYMVTPTLEDGSF